MNEEQGEMRSESNSPASEGIAGRIASMFITSKLTPLLIIATIFIGIVSVVLTPKEEEPQIVVPMVDIIVPYPGANAKDVEKTVSEPLEQLMWEIPGVDYVYSTSMNDMSLVIVRFKVGEDEEESITKLKTKIDYNMDIMPQGVRMPLIKKRSIDDVPQMTLTFWSEEHDGAALRQIASEVEYRLKSVEGVSETTIKGGYRRTVRIEPNITALKAHGVDMFMVQEALNISNAALNVGHITRGGEVYYIAADGFFTDVNDVSMLVVGVHQGKPVYLKDVAAITDGPEEPDQYHLMGFNEEISSQLFQAVTITIAKRKGADSVVVAGNLEDALENLEGYVIPENVHVSITRNYGESAKEKVLLLLEHLLGAIVAVIIVMSLAMGWRAGIVVFVAVPVTFALTLFVYYMFGYTLNRVTLFALIFVAGLVVDDAIIVVENMERHFSMGTDNLLKRAIHAVAEVGNPTILATITVIVAIYPMAFVRGLMGPYMAPMPIGASLAMIFSLGVALIITPWLSYKLLKGHSNKGEELADETVFVKTTPLYKFYKKILTPLMQHVRYRFVLGGVLLALFAGAFIFIPTEWVVMKMLPFDNKNEMQIIIDMPESTPLEQTGRVAMEVGDYLSTVREVSDYQIYTGISAPYNFNGLVRHYFMRQGPNVADIQVNFVDKHYRKDQSHDLAKIIRGPVQEIGAKYDANIKVTEVPPGPPVLSTLVAEVYGPTREDRTQAAAEIRSIFENTEGVVDVDWYEEDPMVRLNFEVNKEKAALVGVSTEMVSNTLFIALSGMKAGILHTGEDREDVTVMLRLPEDQRSFVESLESIHLMSRSGNPVSLSELVVVKETLKETPVYHKNLMPAAYVTADVAGEIESPVYAILAMKDRVADITVNGEKITQHWTSQPPNSQSVSVKWDGEWQITYEVFRDLGLAFAAVLVIMYFVLVGWFKSFWTPIIMMVPIPLSLLGIIPGHFLFGEFFTATSMIGFIALAGIMVRNAVLLIDFVEEGLAKGKTIEDAVIESGAIRTRPVVLTTIAVIAGALFMLPDPIFAGLGVSLITGAIVSTLLTLVIIPLLYYVSYDYMTHFHAHHRPIEEVE